MDDNSLTKQIEEQIKMYEERFSIILQINLFNSVRNQTLTAKIKESINLQSTEADVLKAVGEVLQQGFEEGGIIISTTDTLSINFSHWAKGGMLSHSSKTLAETYKRVCIEIKKVPIQNKGPTLYIQGGYKPEPCATLDKIRSDLENQFKNDFNDCFLYKAYISSDFSLIKTLEKIHDLIRLHYHPNKPNNNIAHLNISTHTKDLIRCWKAHENFYLDLNQPGGSKKSYTYSVEVKKIIEQAINYLVTINPRFAKEWASAYTSTSSSSSSASLYASDETDDDLNSSPAPQFVNPANVPYTLTYPQPNKLQETKIDLLHLIKLDFDDEKFPKEFQEGLEAYYKSIGSSSTQARTNAKEGWSDSSIKGRMELLYRMPVLKKYPLLLSKEAGEYYHVGDNTWKDKTDAEKKLILKEFSQKATLSVNLANT